jgi:hypothetical protein
MAFWRDIILLIWPFRAIKRVFQQNRPIASSHTIWREASLVFGDGRPLFKHTFLFCHSSACERMWLRHLRHLRQSPPEYPCKALWRLSATMTVGTSIAFSKHALTRAKPATFMPPPLDERHARMLCNWTQRSPAPQSLEPTSRAPRAF